MTRKPLPIGLIDNPRLDQWIGFETSGKVRIATGKVELGQGILTALVQIAAEELDIAPTRIVLATGDTAASPSEGYTAGSMSVENSGGSIRLAAAEVRALMLAAAALRLNCAASELVIVDGAVARQGAPTGLDYWTMAPSVDLNRLATGAVSVKPIEAHVVMGTNLPRVDLPAKVFGSGAPFIHDVRASDMLHARVIRQPWPGAVLDTASLGVAGDGETVLIKGNFIAVMAPTERGVTRAAERMIARARWSGGRPHDAGQVAPGWVATAKSIDATTERGAVPPASVGVRQFRQRYTKPFLAHASIGPSCALARNDGRRLTVWTHAQGVFFLRGAIARSLSIDPTHIHVIHLQGAGCYGHNGADDAACDAAVIAMSTPGKTVRVQWSREDELAASPLGSAMVVELSAELSTAGRPLSWTTEIWSGPHAQRPGANGGVNLLAADAMPNSPPRPLPQELPETSGYSAMRNAPLLYDVSHQRLINHVAADIVPRTSSMRELGAFANVFAIESFMDELAAEVGIDPVTYRLGMISDPRARAVIEKAAAMAGWREGAARAEGHGRGFGYSRYKNRAGYLALVVDVHVADAVRIDNVWCAVDCGLVISPDGVRNQVEGGIIQAASWALKEQVMFANGRVAVRSWDDYPILKFSEVPEIEIALMAQHGEPALGVGEVAQGPMGAAIANAVAAALGVRIRDLPLTRERIISAAHA